MKRLFIGLSIVLSILFTAGCQQDKAQTASNNLRTAADNFEVLRRIVFYNAHEDVYMYTVDGLCSIEDQPTKLKVTCKVGVDPKTGEALSVQHMLGKSNITTYFLIQLSPVSVSEFHHRIVFRPQSMFGDVEIEFNEDQWNAKSIDVVTGAEDKAEYAELQEIEKKVQGAN